MTLQELLKRWSELERDRCAPSSIPGAYCTPNEDGTPFWALEPHKMEQGDADQCDFALLDRSIKTAIKLHKINDTPLLLYKQENSTDGKSYAQVWDLERNVHSSGVDEDPAIALLTAYVNWLEKSQEAQS